MLDRDTILKSVTAHADDRRQRGVRRLVRLGSLARGGARAESDLDFVVELDRFIRTFLERDVPQLGISIPAATLRRFWTMVAHLHGQVWNASELARSLGSAESTARRYLDLLSSVFLVRQLPPWIENVSKRQVKAPKVYVRDSGLLHALLGLGDKAALEGHPKLGASWEGFAVEQVLQLCGERNAYFWGTHGGAELDLLVFVRGKRVGIELKYGDVPKTTRSMRTAIDDLGLERVLVVHPGRDSFALDDRIEAVSILDLEKRVAALPR